MKLRTSSTNPAQFLRQTTKLDIYNFHHLHRFSLPPCSPKPSPSLLHAQPLLRACLILTSHVPFNSTAVLQYNANKVPIHAKAFFTLPRSDRPQKSRPPFPHGSPNSGCWCLDFVLERACVTPPSRSLHLPKRKTQRWFYCASFWFPE